MANEQGLALTGPDALLELSTKNVLETALNNERTAPARAQQASP
ncbi:hypothetical protein V6S67_19425 [Arthrobacter sp. Soc17.1.1.1]